MSLKVYSNWDGNSIYDVPLKSWDGKEGLLEKYKGKVTLIINVTADCGNAPQYGIIESIYQKYKDQGFEVVAIPTNDYCGPGVTYGKYEEGIVNAEEAKKYAEKNYKVSYSFSEMIKSNPDPSEWGSRTKNKTTHELYKALSKKDGYQMGGNFEKFLVDRRGRLAQIYPNYTLLDYAYVNFKDGLENSGGTEKKMPMTYSESFDILCKEIELALALPLSDEEL